MAPEASNKSSTESTCGPISAGIAAGSPTGVPTGAEWLEQPDMAAGNEGPDAREPIGVASDVRLEQSAQRAFNRKDLGNPEVRLQVLASKHNHWRRLPEHAPLRMSDGKHKDKDNNEERLALKTLRQ